MLCHQQLSAVVWLDASMVADPGPKLIHECACVGGHLSRHAQNQLLFTDATAAVSGPVRKDGRLTERCLVFQMKKELADNDSISQEVVGNAHIENYALKMFLYADNEDRAGRFHK